jgi:hypothetical protein
MNTDLQKLIELAKKHTISPAEHQAQVRSFTYGNTRLENEAITREDVNRVVTKLNGQIERGYNPAD